jgi:hypothetical protein
VPEIDGLDYAKPARKLVYRLVIISKEQYEHQNTDSMKNKTPFCTEKKARIEQ